MNVPLADTIVIPPMGAASIQREASDVLAIQVIGSLEPDVLVSLHALQLDVLVSLHVAGNLDQLVNSVFSLSLSSPIDIDECASRTDGCSRGTGGCSNTPGSYTCYCNSGYRLVNGRTCTGER